MRLVQQEMVSKSLEGGGRFFILLRESVLLFWWELCECCLVKCSLVIGVHHCVVFFAPPYGSGSGLGKTFHESVGDLVAVPVLVADSALDPCSRGSH